MSRGPQPDILAPSSAIVVAPGQSLQSAINAAPPGTAFRLLAGVHEPRAVTPKTGNLFVGDYGAILDGTGWTTTDIDDGAFKAMNVDVDDVTIRNLVVRNMPQKGIMAWRDFSAGWVVDHCDIDRCKNGVELPENSAVTNSVIRRCVGTPGHSNPAERGGGYSFNSVAGIRFLNNEVSENGSEQKWILCTGILCVGNFFHHNAYSGPWIDGGGSGSLIEDNVSDDNGGPGVCIEIGDHAIVRRNSCNRNKEGGVLLSLSQVIEVSENTLGDNAFGIDLFVDCVRLSENYPPHPQPDLANNTIRRNSVIVGVGQLAVVFTYVGGCGAPYVDNTSKNNRFLENAYAVPGPGRYWIWGNGNNKTFEEWQALGFDTTTTPPPDPPEPEPEPPDPEPQPPLPTCTLGGQTYPEGSSTEVTVKKGKVDDWAGQNPDWQVVSARPHPKNKTQVIVTVRCVPQS